MIRAWLGAALCLAWVVLTVAAYFRARRRPVAPLEEPVQPWDMSRAPGHSCTLVSGPTIGDGVFRVVVPPTTSWTI